MEWPSRQKKQWGRIGVSEVVLRTRHYERLCAFYTEVLRQPPTLDMTPESAVGTTDPDVPTRIAFFNLPSEFPYTQRVAVFECAGVEGAGSRAVGLHHFQLRYPDLTSLFDQYEHLKALDHLPIESANHGIATSFYYLDPDGNRVELSVMNFSTEEETTTQAPRRIDAGISESASRASLPEGRSEERLEVVAHDPTLVRFGEIAELSADVLPRKRQPFTVGKI